MTALQKTIVTATIAVLAGVGIYEARQASQLREQNQTLRQQQVPLMEQIQQLQIGFSEATNRLASLRDENERLNRNTAELLKLRGDVGLLRNHILTTKNAQQTMTNQMQFRLPYLPRESWIEKGTEEPLNTILTMFWAVKQADETRLEQLVLRMGASQSLDQLTFPKQDWANISGVQILNTFEFFPAGGEQANVEVIFEKELPDLDSPSKDQREKDLEVRRWILTKTNNQWLITGRR